MTPPGNMINSAANSVRSTTAARLATVFSFFFCRSGAVCCRSRARRTDSGVSAGKVSQPLGFPCSSVQRMRSMARTALGPAVGCREQGQHAVRTSRTSSFVDWAWTLIAEGRDWSG